MPNTYTQLYIHIVFAVKGRKSIIVEGKREEVQKYMTGIVHSSGSKLISIYCMPDHCHLLIGHNPDQSISSLVQKIKSNTSKWINEKRIYDQKFAWQSGYGAFSYSRSQIDTVAKYIRNQPQHHAKRTFREEYIQLLDKFNIEYNPDYLFDRVD
ncbi:IS200/IS605 family transposase [Roseivirga sp. BDSF3-8]|uniref:IS200/IS605 family transposase n=1 Tax=Roseivirga sp. BDSF3-8 TaxID=3241598 RepID=UPI00353198AE